MNVAERDSANMRAQLAGIGITLDDPRAAMRRYASTAKRPAVQVDRAAIRAILVANGAPAADLEWLTASCPGEAEALAYQPTCGAS